MTTEPEKPPEPEAEPDAGMIQKIRDEISSALGKLFDTGKADVRDDAGGDPAPGKGRDDVAAEVKREVAKLRDAEAKADAERSLAERVAELEKLLKKATEEVPEEFRWITEKMWR